ncbi:MAG: sulfotransferase [Cyanobacteria bacterium J06628_6]
MLKTTKQWPNLFVVGAAKAGTTSLYHYLSQHPDIYMSPIKEPHFFSDISPAERYMALSGCVNIQDAKTYLGLFERRRQHSIVGEASPSYLWDEQAPAKIQQVSPNAKIVIMLREPTSRAYSHYLNEVRAGLEKRPFLEALQADLASRETGWGVSPLYVALGQYSQQVQRYLDRFEAVHVVFFEEFIKDVEGHLRQLFEFLAVDPAWAAEIELEAQNGYAIATGPLGKFLIGTPWVRQLARQLMAQQWRGQLKQLVLKKAPKPQMDEQARALLKEIYQSELEQLPQLLGRELPWQIS